MPTTTRSRERTKTLEKQQALEPNNVDLAINLGEAYLREGRLDEAALVYARASELDPRSTFRAHYWEWLGLVRESRGELEQALEAYDNWADADPLSVEPVDRAGTLLVALGRWTDLALLRSQYGRRAECNSDPRILESTALFTYVMEQMGVAEDPPPLAQTYAALEVESRSVAMRYLLGVLFYRSGHLDAASAEFLRVLELDSDRTWVERRFSLGWRASTAWLMLGRIARLQGRIPDALQYLQSCLQTTTDNLEPLEELTSLLVEQGAYEEALALLPEGDDELELEVPPWIRRLRARCFLGLGRVDEAARLLAPPEVPRPRRETAPRSDPKIRARLAEAEGLLKSGRFQEAMDAFSALGPARKRPLEARRGMARAAGGLGHWKEAARHLEAVVRELPEDAEAWSLLTEAYRRCGQPVRCRLARLQLEAVALGPTPPQLQEWIAPASPDSDALGLGVSARSLPGEGRLTVTGVPGAEAAAHIAWTWLRAEAEALGLPAPSSRDVHVHVRELDPGLREPALPGEAPPGWPAPGEVDVCGEDLGLAVLAALATALRGRTPTRSIAVAGRVDLNGGVHGSPSLVPGLARLREGGLTWDRLLVPRTMAAEIHRLPEEVWTTADLVLCADATQALQALEEEEIG